MVEFDEIVVAVDGSEAAGRAARFAARLAGATSCPVKLLYVFPATGMAMVGFSRMSAEEIKHAQHSAAQTAMEKARAALRDGGVNAEELVIFGDPAEEIINYADNHKVLVVRGRRGLSTMKYLVLGSVSEKVMRHACGAVTLVS